MKSIVAVIVLLAGVTLLAGESQQASQVEVKVVMSGLDNPRGLAFGQQGALYVAKAGRGVSETEIGAEKRTVLITRVVSRLNLSLEKCGFGSIRCPSIQTAIFMAEI